MRKKENRKLSNEEVEGIEDQEQSDEDKEIQEKGLSRENEEETDVKRR